MRKSFSVVLIMVSSIWGADVPIIFIHGHKSEGRPYYIDENGNIVGGITTWYPMKPNGALAYPTAMTKIIGYQGYDWGVKDDGSPAIDCDINTELMPDQGTKRVFNFSYYHPQGELSLIHI